MMPTPLDDIHLLTGWNFIGITPDMINKELKDIKGSCNFEKVYIFDNRNQEWMSLRVDEDDFDGGSEGMGAVIKVSNDCKLGSSYGNNVPPGIPNNSGECTDSDGGIDYYVKGVTKGVYADGTIFDLDEVCEANNTEVHEYYCKESNPNGNLDEQRNNDWTNYVCPNGCLDGACIQ